MIAHRAPLEWTTGSPIFVATALGFLAWYGKIGEGEVGFLMGAIVAFFFTSNRRR